MVKYLISKENEVIEACVNLGEAAWGLKPPPPWCSPRSHTSPCERNVLLELIRDVFTFGVLRDLSVWVICVIGLLKEYASNSRKVV